MLNILDLVVSPYMYMQTYLAENAQTEIKHYCLHFT